MLILAEEGRGGLGEQYLLSFVGLILIFISQFSMYDWRWNVSAKPSVHFSIRTATNAIIYLQLTVACLRSLLVHRIFASEVIPNDQRPASGMVVLDLTRR